MLISLQNVLAAQETFEDKKIFLPIVKNGERDKTVFGMEIVTLNEDRIKKAEESGTYWVRTIAFSWAKIEPIRKDPPEYNWDAVDENYLKELNKKGLKTIAIIYHTPTWAEKIPGETCGPIHETKLDAYSQFVKAVVSRYGFSDYNIKYWEFINEPDAPWAGPFDSDIIFGCWGDTSDGRYYGGEYYAEMLKFAYPAVKSIDPNGQVVLGGLLIGCDPTFNPVACPAGNFFRGILENGGGDFFDIANYHAYAWFGYNKIMDETDTIWEYRGGAVKGKANYLEEIMEDYGISKPMILSEAALVCDAHSDCDDTEEKLEDFYEYQADYIMRLFSSSKTIGLLGSIWHKLDGDSWRYTGLLNNNNEPKPAYNAFQFMTQEMQGTTVLGESTDYSGVTTYRFSASDKQIWVMWSTDQSDKAVNLPLNTIRVLDKYGTVIYYSPIPSRITINRPVYVELELPK